jgi:CheY-like chemotaxis protein
MHYTNELDQAYGYDVIHSSASYGCSRVLLADGDALLRRRMAQALRSDGHTVIEVENGEQLLQRIASEVLQPSDGGAGIDLIVADAELTGVSGLWVLASLRSFDWATPFILLASDESPAIDREAKRLGAAAVLGKPLALRPLRDAVSSITGVPYVNATQLAVGM